MRGPGKTLAARLLLAAALLPAARAAVPHQHFEGRQTHPIAITPDGLRLLALNTPDARLSVFDISNPLRHAPLLIAEIPVGLEPVSVRAKSNNEIWVVNELSDSISIVDLAARAVTATLTVPDEPADLVFSGTKAFVSCAANHLIRVLDIATLTEIAVIPVDGNQPRALTVSADGSRVYAACLLSGNQTTILPEPQAPAPPAPTNPLLPPAPRTALIVPAADPRIPYTVLDHDVAEISTSSHTIVRWFGGIGTHLFDAAVHPVTQALWIPNSHSLNLTRFEPNLRGHFIDHRVAILTLPSGATAIHDLNPGIDYQTLPNPAAQATALAQPTAIVFPPDGSAAWIAAFNSDRVAKIGPDGAVLTRVDLRPPLPPGSTVPNNSALMRGPRGLAINAAGTRLYALNKLSNTISVIDPAAATLLAEVPAGSHDPTPAALKAGRGFLFDARPSGNGTMSCASCHLDADTDGLAWDLGDPGGSMITVIGYNNSVHNPTPQNRVMHPMKGPMLTQTLRGLTPGQLLHWRGDRPSIASFNATFPALMAAPEISTADMENLTAYLNSLRLHPNPNRRSDRSLPTALDGGNAQAGRLVFLAHDLSHCATCHASSPTNPGTGTDNNVDLMQEVASTQPVKTPHLRLVHRHLPFSRTAGAQNVTGFGILKDGSAPTSDLPIGHPYALENLTTLTQFNDLRAFLLAFDTGTAPTVGLSRTLTGFPAPGSAAEADLNLLEARANTVDCDLTVRGRVNGVLRGYTWNKGTARYDTDRAGEPALTRAVLLASLTPGDTLTFTGVLPAIGTARGRDRDENGILDGDEPHPSLTLAADPANGPILQWDTAPANGWYPESTANPATAPWLPLATPARQSGTRTLTETGTPTPARFFRLRKAW